MPKVSVVIPTYNRAGLISETIQSVLDQTFADFEIVVVDDGSTDNTKDVVASFEDSRIKYIYQENRGLSAARNTGANASNTDYILFLDSDDLLLPHNLAKCVTVLDNHPDVAFVYGQIIMVDAKDGHVIRVRGSSFMRSTGIVDRYKQIKELLFGCRITPSATLVRRQCFNDVGCYCQEIKAFGEDQHFAIRVVKLFPIFYLAEPLIKYRVHNNSLTNITDHCRVEKSLIMALKEIYEDQDIAPYFQRWKGPAYSHAYQWAASVASKTMDAQSMRNYLIKAVRVYPQVMLRRQGFTIVRQYLTSYISKRVWRFLRIVKHRYLQSSTSY
jgi:glycosyltransferase involved in cell wall biosynthesis